MDSTACAILLREQGYDVTLGYVDWETEGSTFGSLQRTAAYEVADLLKLPLDTIAKVTIPEKRHTRWCWVSVVAPFIYAIF